MVDEIIPIKCPACGKDDYVFGKVQSQYGICFLPEGNIFKGYALEAYACMNCGHVFHYLTDESLDQLREKQSCEK